MNVNKNINRNNDFFTDDYFRQKLALKNQLMKLTKSYPKTKKDNPNSAKFWDEKIIGNKQTVKIDPMTKDRINSTVKFIDKSSDKILDIGIGYGLIEEKINKTRKKIKLYGIDISNKGVNKAQKKHIGQFKVGSVLKIPFKNNFFDTITILEVLEHILPTDTFKAFKEIRRVLKTNAQLIISVPVNETYTESYNPNKHMRSYSEDLIKAELKIAGFEIKQIKRLYAFSKYYFLKNILRKVLINRWQPNVILINARKICPARTLLVGQSRRN